jgi:hypothetical protein
MIHHARAWQPGYHTDMLPGPVTAVTAILARRPGGLKPQAGAADRLAYQHARLRISGLARISSDPARRPVGHAGEQLPARSAGRCAVITSS